MKKTLKLYLTTLLAFLGIDALWLGLIAPAFYRSQIGHLMAENPNFLAAAVFYLIFIFGMVYFVVEPGVHEGTLKKAVLRGALYGFITYATYDLTNHATLKDWTLLMTVVDMTWGTVLSASVTLVSVWAGKKLFK
ncbi:MAG: DUF2177 family protein [Methylococcales bacterium]|nr:DUF2177 family protein [Methylococcales bacterium]